MLIEDRDHLWSLSFFVINLLKATVNKLNYVIFVLCGEKRSFGNEF